MGWYARQKARSDEAKAWPGGRMAKAKAKTITKDGTKAAAVAKVSNAREASNLIEAMDAYGYELEQQSGQGMFGGKTLMTFRRRAEDAGRFDVPTDGGHRIVDHDVPDVPLVRRP